MQDIFLYDKQANTITNITITGNGASYNPVISSDGRYITFHSSASNLVTGDTNDGVQDIFVYDIQSNTIINITMS